MTLGEVADSWRESAPKPHIARLDLSQGPGCCGVFRGTTQDDKIEATGELDFEKYHAMARELAEKSA